MEQSASPLHIPVSIPISRFAFTLLATGSVFMSSYIGVHERYR